MQRIKLIGKDDDLEYVFNMEDIMIIGNKLYELTEDEKTNYFKGEYFKKFLNDLENEESISEEFDLELYIVNIAYNLDFFNIELINDNKKN